VLGGLSPVTTVPRLLCTRATGDSALVPDAALASESEFPSVFDREVLLRETEGFIDEWLTI
jgi:hypothetical protein